MAMGTVTFPSPTDLSPDQMKEILDLAKSDSTFLAGLPVEFVQEILKSGA